MGVTPFQAFPTTSPAARRMAFEAACGLIFPVATPSQLCQLLNALVGSVYAVDAAL